MATTVTQELTYDAPAAEVAAMLWDASFREQVCEAIGTTRKEVTAGPEGGGTKVVIDMDQPAAGIPGFAKKFVGDRINIVQTEHWSDQDHARVDVVIPGKPGQMSGSVQLHESGGATMEVVEMEIRVNVPLVGGRIEALIADMLNKALRTENAVGREYLANRA
jgi:Protein of unknown function (DUF2505)